MEHFMKIYIGMRWNYVKEENHVLEKLKALNLDGVKFIGLHSGDCLVEKYGITKASSADVARVLATEIGKDPQNSKGIGFCKTGWGVEIYANTYQDVLAGKAVSPKDAENMVKVAGLDILCLPVEPLPKNWKNIAVKFITTQPDFSDPDCLNIRQSLLRAKNPNMVIR